MAKYIFNLLDEQHVAPAGLGRQMLGTDKTLKFVSKHYPPRQIEKDKATRITSEELHSIPSPWARALLYHAALVDETHPAHKDVVSEWRGLLALLCFRKDREIIGEDFIQFFRTPINKKSPDKFIRILASLQERIWPDDEIVLIKRGTGAREPDIIGAVSPYTLVFSPAQRYESSVKWWSREHGRFFDPTLKDKLLLDPPRLNRLKVWLKKLLETFDRIFTYLDEHTRDPHGSHIPAIDQELWFHRWEDWKDAADIKVIFSDIKELLQKWAEEIEVEATALGEISPSRDLPLPYRRVLSPFDPNARPVVNRTPIAVHFAAVVTLDEKIFSEYLVKLNPQSQIVNKHAETAMSDTGRMIVFPLKSEIFAGNDDELLPAVLEIFEWEDNKVFVSLGIQTPTGITYFKKLYENDKIIDLSSDPLLEIWPNFIADKWSIYYVLFADADNNGDRPELRCVIKDAQKTPLEPHAQIQLPKEKEDYGHIWLTDRAPRHVELKTVKNGAGKAGGQSAGTLLLNFHQSLTPNEIQEAHKRRTGNWDKRVVIDFGTSNTMVVTGWSSLGYRIDYDKEIPLQIFNYPERESILLKHFFPFEPDFPETGLPSVVNYTKALEHNFEGDFDKLLFRCAAVPFIKEFGAFSQHLSNINLKEGIKWNINNSDEDQTAANTFIFLMILFVAAYARRFGENEVELYWTYPGAFSEQFLVFYEGGLEKIVKLVSEKAGVSFRHSSNRDMVVKTIKESLAVAAYIQPEGGKNVVTLGVDIGGGTTDIAVFHEQKFIGQCSLRFAGGDIVRRIVAEDKICKFLLTMKDLKANEPAFRRLLTSENTRDLFLTLLLKNKFDVFKDFVLYAPKQEALKRIRTLSFYLMGAYAYYIGMLVNRFENVDQVVVQFLGNGANFNRLVTIASNSAKQIKMLKNLIRAGFRIVSNRELENIDIKFSLEEHQKKEVGLGVLKLTRPSSDELTLDEKKDARGFIIFGEKGITLENEHETMACSASDEIDLTRWGQCRFDELVTLRDFIANMRIVADELLLEKIFEEEEKQVLVKMKNAIGKKHSEAQAILGKKDTEMDEAKARFENNSPFIIGIRALIESLPHLQ